MYQIRPIGPDDVKKSIPEFVIEAVNELINEKCNSSFYFSIRQSEIVERIQSKTTQDFDWAWMDFEKLYRDAGWHVTYDKPCIGDDYEANFKFSRK